MVPEEFDLSMLAQAIDDCRTLIDEARLSEASPALERTEPLPSLLEQCERLIARLPGELDPIRTIHHFACTGGTLISKCLACMPNTQLLSEVEPFSQMQTESFKGFNPTDLIQQLRHGSRGTDTRLEAELFLAGLRVLYLDCQRKGLRLVLRDHSHSRYCVGAAVADTPPLRELVGSIVSVRAIITVRHPFDSYLSVQDLGWLHFEPATLDEYCHRYLRFLDENEGVPLFKYEDFVESPAATLSEMCKSLSLPFVEGFEQLFSVHRLSGDSGRSSDVIRAVKRRMVPDMVMAEAKESAPFETLCNRLGYQAG